MPRHAAVMLTRPPPEPCIEPTLAPRLLRRHWLVGTPLLLLGAGCAAVKGSPADLRSRFAAIEAASGGKLGVCAIDTASGRRVVYHEQQRFAMASTFKLLLAAMALSRVDAGTLQLDLPVPFTSADLVSYSPVLASRVVDGAISVAELCRASIEISDNGAANLLLGRLGGPAGLTAYLRGLGDAVTRLDRLEPELNSNLPDDPRDTTTPAAMAALLQTLFTGTALSQASRERLTGWLVASRTGLGRLRAGVPAGWSVGDKTGSGARGAVNDVAIVWPPGRAPWVVAVYTSGSAAPVTLLNSAHEQVMKLVAGVFQAAGTI